MHMNKELKPLTDELLVHTSVGNVVIIDHVYQECEIEIDVIVMTIDLLPLELKEFDVILGMHFLSKYHTNVDYFKNEVVFKNSRVAKVVSKGKRKIFPICLMSAIKDRKMLRKGCEAFLAHVVEAKPTKLKPEGVPVVCEYLDVFPKELSRLPPNREVEFTIDLVPGTTFISQAPYRMAPAKLKKLNVQLQELVDKSYIRSSVLHQYYL